MGCKGFVSYEMVSADGIQVKGVNYMDGGNGKDVGISDSP